MTVETRSPTAVGTNAWTNNTNAYSNNGTDATCAPGKNLSVLGIWKTYGFTLGAEATISAVEVGIDWWVSTTISKASMNIEISWDGGATWGAHAWAEADTEAHVATGGDTHWFVCTADTAWTPTKTNDTNLQVRISGVQGNSSNAVTFYLDYVPVRITYATIVTSPAKKCVYHMRNTVNNPRKFPYHIRNLVFYGYAYKASLIISGSTEAVTYYQIKLIINKTSGTNSAGTIYLNDHSLNWPYDICFKNSSGGNLDFWRESYDTNTMTVWVECDSVPISPGTATFFIYYGKSGAADVSNGSNTFVFFDDFPGAAIDTGKWGGDTASTTVSSSILTIYGATAWKSIQSLITSSPPAALRMKTQIDGAGVSAWNDCGFRDPVTTDMVTLYAGNPTKLRNYNSGTGTTVDSNWDGNQNIYDILWTTTSTRFYQNAAELTNSPISTNAPSKALPAAFSCYAAAGTADIHCDWVLIRKYLGTEPGYGAFGTESVAENSTRRFVYNILSEISTISKGIVFKYNISGILAKTIKLLYNIMPNIFLHLYFVKNSLNPFMAPNGAWEGSLNICDEWIIEEPTELRLYYTGHAEGATSGIGLATSPKTYSPMNWTRDNGNPIYSDGTFVRMGSIQKVAGTYFMYYQAGITGQYVGLATSSDGKAFTKYGNVLTISGDEITVEDASVINIDATHWYMYYAYRTASSTLPGIRVATSPDGYEWTKQSGDVLNTGTSGTWDDTYIEHHQIMYTGGYYFLIYEAYSGTNWAGGLAYSVSPTSAFTKYSGNPIIEKSGISGAFDEFHVATPYIFPFNDDWYIFFVGGNVLSPYGDSVWEMGLAGRLYTSKKSVYHIRNLMAVISKSLYNILAGVSSVSNVVKYIYNIKNLISSVNKSIYHMRNITSSAKKFVYHIRNVLSAVSSKSIYHIRNILSTSSKYVYKIRNTISAISKSIYNIAGALVSSLKAIYNMRNLLSVSSKSVYNIRNLISSAKKLVYHIWNKSAATIKAFYNIIGISAAILRAVYHIRNITSASRKSFYHIRNVLAVISKSIYHIRNILSAISKSVYRIRNLTSSINTSVYHIRNALVVSFKSIYNIWNIVSSSKKYIYRIWNKAAAIIKSIYNILGTPSAYLKSIYHMRNLTSSSKRSVYHIRNLVNSIKLSVYHIRNIITSASKSIYKIWNKVSSVRTQIYHIRNSVSQSTKKMVYDIRATISKSLISIYNIITSVNISNAIRAIYHIRGRIESIKSYAYKIGGGLIKALTAIYRIRGLVSGSSRFPYNIRTIISNAEKYIYNIFKNILTSDIYTYTIRGLVSSGKKLMYNIVGRIVSAKNLVYNIRGMISSSPKLFTYSIRKGIQSVKSYLYIIFNFTNASNKFVYTIRNYTVASKKYAYNILNKISSIKSFPYNIRNSIASSMLYSYNIFEQISAAVSSSYIINGIASALLKMVYNIFVYICPDLIGPYYALTGELYNYFNNMTGTGGELEGFTIYKSKPRNTALFFPCIVISVENTRQDDVYGGNYMETATTSIELMFTKKDSHIYTVDSKQITLMQDQLARFYKVKLLELAKGFVSDSINMADSQITATTYGPTRPQHTIYGVKLIVQFAFKGIYWKK